MWPVRVLYWFGALGWGMVTMNFLLGWANRRTLLRFTWTLASAAGWVLLLTKVLVMPPVVRTLLDIAMALGGIVCGAGLMFRYVNNPKVLE